MKTFKTSLFLCLFYLVALRSAAQRIANYVNNGNFEEYYDCDLPYNIRKAKYWMGIDSISTATCYGGLWYSVCNGRVPYSGNSVFQYPRSGEAHLLAKFYHLNAPYTLKRNYSKNRLKSTLRAGKVYCVEFYVNIENGCSYGIDGIGVYFGGNEIDSINYCNAVLNYFTPQIQNPYGNIIKDTLNWIAITGTFTANGTEKYLVIGNFLSDEDTDTMMINPTNLPLMWTDIHIDDVSCIEVDLPAYAGRDTTILLGDSVYIGRELDFAIDSGCVWYKLPDMTNAIDTISGLWVKPAVTTTYVVRQELECSALKWDTVVVSVGYVGIEEYDIKNWTIDLFPNPASDKITLRNSNANEVLNISVTDLTGRIIVNNKIKTNNHAAVMELNIINGAYMTTIKNEQGKTINKKLLIAK